MTSGWIIVVEVIVVLGLAIGWGVHELTTLRRLRQARERAEAARANWRPSDPQG